ncbi:MAG: SpoIIIAH-like family protein [Oscillospiraceae bacterium]|nr:SpoIIIAH-like family protein [Oscillospiraceae bacterium]MBQ9929979.1 SpoIIIAH-like family protein [Oscillospiraceae bacterium]
MKNMKNWQKNLIAAAILVVVCAGIYMNWMYNNAQSAGDFTDTLDTEKVMSQDGILLETEDVSSGDTVMEYFAAVRLSRQQARDSAVELLQEAMAYGESTDNSASSAQLEQIVQTALMEAQIESLVIAKGYTDCVAYMSDDGISVAVASPEGGIQQTDVSLISDIVLTQTELSLDQIRVVEVV